jgi:hypothetical protein
MAYQHRPLAAYLKFSARQPQRQQIIKRLCRTRRLIASGDGRFDEAFFKHKCRFFLDGLSHAIGSRVELPGGEGLAKRKGVAARRGLKKAWSKTAA